MEEPAEKLARRPRKVKNAMCADCTRMKTLDLWIPDITSPDFQAEYPTLSGLSPSYHGCNSTTMIPLLRKHLVSQKVRALV